MAKKAYFTEQLSRFYKKLQKRVSENNPFKKKLKKVEHSPDTTVGDVFEVLAFTGNDDQCVVTRIRKNDGR